MSSQLCPRCLARHWEPALIGDGTLRCRACDFYMTEELAAELAKFNGAERELRRHRDAATIATEALVDAHQARELAERRAASWKLVAKRYRAELAASEQRTEAACRMFNTSEERVRERDILLGELARCILEPEGSTAQTLCRAAALAHKASARYAPFPMTRVPADLCTFGGSAQASSSASGFPGRAAPACKERNNMSGNNGMDVRGAIGAEGGT